MKQPALPILGDTPPWRHRRACGERSPHHQPQPTGRARPQQRLTEPYHDDDVTRPGRADCGPKDSQNRTFNDIGYHPMRHADICRQPFTGHRLQHHQERQWASSAPACCPAGQRLTEPPPRRQHLNLLILRALACCGLPRTACRVLPLAVDAELTEPCQAYSSLRLVARALQLRQRDVKHLQ